jgi:hypothetical protein
MYSEDDIAVPPIAPDESTIYVCVSNGDGQAFPRGDRLALALRYAGLRLLAQTKNVDIFCFSCLTTPVIPSWSRLHKLSV